MASNATSGPLPHSFPSPTERTTPFDDTHTPVPPNQRTHGEGITGPQIKSKVLESKHTIPASVEASFNRAVAKRRPSSPSAGGVTKTKLFVRLSRSVGELCAFRVEAEITQNMLGIKIRAKFDHRKEKTARIIDIATNPTTGTPVSGWLGGSNRRPAPVTASSHRLLRESKMDERCFTV